MYTVLSVIFVEGCDNHQWVLDSLTVREVSVAMKRFTLENHEATLDEV